VIGAETAAWQSEQTGTHLNQELDLLLVHGILHLVGYDHTGMPEDAVAMGRRQKQLVRRIHKRFPTGAGFEV
jgi:probable rRNA maturation factor